MQSDDIFIIILFFLLPCLVDDQNAGHIFLPNEQTVEEVSRRIARFSGVRYKLIKFRTFGVRGELKEHASPDDAYMQKLEKMARDLGVQDIVVT